MIDKPWLNDSFLSKIEAELPVSEEIIALAVVGSDAELLDGLTMFLRGIALVRAPVVLGIFLSELVHIIVTIGLGEDACCSDGEVFTVALHNGRVTGGRFFCYTTFS